jgi:hypothetical protein
MEKYLSPYDQGWIPEAARKEAAERAPSTLVGLGVGGTLGALIAGPRGALAGGIIGGLIGYAHDSERQSK